MDFLALWASGFGSVFVIVTFFLWSHEIQNKQQNWCSTMRAWLLYQPLGNLHDIYGLLGQTDIVPSVNTEKWKAHEERPFLGRVTTYKMNCSNSRVHHGALDERGIQLTNIMWCDLICRPTLYVNSLSSLHTTRLGLTCGHELRIHQWTQVMPGLFRFTQEQDVSFYVRHI